MNRARNRIEKLERTLGCSPVESVLVLFRVSDVPECDSTKPVGRCERAHLCRYPDQPLELQIAPNEAEADFLRRAYAMQAAMKHPDEMTEAELEQALAEADRIIAAKEGARND